MKCVILAAGYATRLYPLTEHYPKPLLPVGGKPILDWLIEDVERSGKADGYVLISNHKFFSRFVQWAKERPWPVTLLDDGSLSNETRLGAVRDIRFAIESLGLNEDLLVIAGDNLLDFSLADFIAYAQKKGTTCLMRYYEPRKEKLHKCGVAQVNGQDRILSMEEKPAHPRSHWCTPPFYYYRRQDLPLVAAGIDAGCGTDAPGSFIAWLCGQTPVHAYEMPGKRYDIGDTAGYRQVQETYRGIQ